MTRIALILCGGGSLGAYTAGAATELLEGLARNRQAGARVGVIAGASGGALTAAVAARALVVNPRLVPWIETTWVRGMDAGVLLDPGRAPRDSLLGASAMDEISRALIAGPRASDDEPSPLLAQPLGLGLTLSNLHGVPRSVGAGFPHPSEHSVGTRLHDDWIAFQLTSEEGPASPVWEKVRSAAVASAAFPLAFPPQRLATGGSAIAGHGREDAGTDGTWCADGGLFNHEPLRLAKRLVLRSGAPGDDWHFVVVDPGLRRDPTDVGGTAAAPPSAARVASLVTQALLRRGSAEDWMRANRTNDRLAILDALVARLPELADALTDPEDFELGRAVGELAEQVAEWRLRCSRSGRWQAAGRGRTGADPALELLEEGLTRVEQRYANALARVESRAGRSRLAKLMFILQAAGGLDDKETVPLQLVAPRARLAGDLLGGFGGYFCREWREADFRAGRRDARELVERSLSDVVSYEPAEREVYAVPEPPETLDALPPADHLRLERLVAAQMKTLVGGIDAGPLASLLGFVWKPALRRWAAGRALAALRASG